MTQRVAGAARHFISGQWIAGTGPEFKSTDPTTEAINWHGAAAAVPEVNQAVSGARGALEEWAELPLETRIGHVQAIARQYVERKGDLAEAICRETGKPRWEALAEADAMAAKIPLSIDAMQQRRMPVSSEAAGVTSATRYKPHGVVAVLGPFNMPGHLPNGHIIPALLAGNTVVFKPSEQTPLVGELMAELWAAAELPPGVVNVIQGGRETGAELARHPGLDGLFFTGSFAAGHALSRLLADQPGRILALEMGGNNPLLVHRVADLDAAAYATIQSAFITAGQRCSCARRLILCEGKEADAFLDRLIAMTAALRVGAYTDEREPFMGPVISREAADGLLKAQVTLLEQGGRPLLPMRRLDRSPAMLSPGLIDVSRVANRADAELFGPILQVIRVNDFDAALIETNRTRYGLCAGLLSDDAALYERFVRKIRAGVVNWNRPLTGASSQLPFGGIGDSGNHRPSGFWAADYCSYPIASLETPRLVLPAKLAPGVML